MNTNPYLYTTLSLCLFLLTDTVAIAQHADDNAILSAEDAFGNTVGHDSIGIYSDSNIRGFSPDTAGNIRIDGLYFDNQGGITSRVSDTETIRVGPSVQGYAFPSPTGIVDMSLAGSGDKLIISPQSGISSRGSLRYETDIQMPLVPGQLSLAGGFGLFHTFYGNGGGNKHWNIGLVPHWKPSYDIEVTGFFSREQTYGDTSQALYLPDSEILPPKVTREIYPGPLFDRTDSYTQAFGVITRVQSGNWIIRAGLFRSLGIDQPSFANIINVAGNDSTDRQAYAYPDSRARSTSGEARVEREIREGPRQHLLMLAIRGRDSLSIYGDADVADFGTAGLNDVIEPPEPEWRFTPPTHDHIHQISLGGSYALKWQGLGTLTLSVLRTHYARDVAAPGQDVTHSVTDRWLPSAALAIPLIKHLVAYGSYVRGLEDSGVAPYYATNGGQLLPTVATRQYDFGMKWSEKGKISLIAGYFNIIKPYYDLDTSQIYTALGHETHSGIETSLTAIPSKSLTLVLGGYFASPHLVASPDVAEATGSRPVNQPRNMIQFNANYVIKFLKGLSLNASVNHSSSVAGTLNNLVIVPATTTFNLGSRYNFKIIGKSSTFRISFRNIFNNYSWIPASSGVYIYNEPRDVTASLSIDI